MTKFREVVHSRSRRAIERDAAKARSDLGLTPFDKVNMAKLVDLELPKMIQGYEMHVAPDQELGAAEAVTDLRDPFITFSERTYNALLRGDGRARMTAAHEIGHLLMHCRRPVGVAFMTKSDLKVDPEWQADTFAAAFLMPEEAFRRMRSLRQAMSAFGVSRDAAACRARKLKMYWMVTGGNPPRPKKKGRKLMARAP